MKIKMSELPVMKASVIAVQDLPGQTVKFALAIARNTRTLEPEEITYQQQREKIIHEFCIMEEDGKPALRQDGKNLIFTFPDDEAEKASSEKVKELDEQEIDLDLMTLKESDLPKDITPLQVMGLLPFIDEPKKKKK